MSLQPVMVSPREVAFSQYNSSLKTDYASGVSAITIYDITQFAINQVLLIGEYGDAGSEIIKTHGSTAPTGFTVTLVANTTKPHTKDTPVYILSFDQVEFSHADTLTGAKSVLGSVVNIDPGQELMKYDDTTNTSGYYFTRFKNSITGIFSDYSDGLPYTGMPTNTVGYAIDTAMNELHVSFSEKLTFGMMIGFSKQMLSLVRGKLKSWNKYKEYEQNFGTVEQGIQKYTLPTAVYDKTTNKSIISLRVGEREPLIAISRYEYLQLIEDAVVTSVATEGTVGATSLVLSDTSDLDDTGTINIYVSGTKYEITYTVNTRSTNTLTIASSQITATLPVSSMVWQDSEVGEPRYYNISGGYLYLWPLADSNFTGRNITGDYFTDIEDIDSQMDVITGNYFSMLMPYLKYKIRAIEENSGKEDLRDPSYAEFRELLNDQIKLETFPEGTGFRPRRRVANRGSETLYKR